MDMQGDYTPREKRLKKLLRHISKSDLQTQRLTGYLNHGSLPSPSRKANRRRKLSASRNSGGNDIIYVDSEEEGARQDRLPCNYANLSLRKTYMNTPPGGAYASDDDSRASSPSTHPLKNGTDCETAKNVNTPEIIIDKALHLRAKNNVTKSSQDENVKVDPTILYPSVSFADIGGLDDTLKEIGRIFARVKDCEKYEVFGKSYSVKNLLLHGPSGCGKSLIVNAFSSEFQLPLMKVSATEVISGISGQSEKSLRAVFDKAVLHMPCILFIDNIDTIVPKRETAERDMSKRIVNELVCCMDELKTKKAKVVVIAATNRPNALDSALRTSGRFDKEVYIGIPNADARLEILRVICNQLTLSPEFDLKWLVDNTPGYVGADLMEICDQAMDKAVERIYLDEISEKQDELGISELSHKTLPSLWNNKSPLESYQGRYYLEKRDFDCALKSYVPSTKREGFPDIPSITWDEVGALKKVKKILNKVIIWPVKYKDKFKESCVGSCSGILLCGPKGCGKTLIAQAVANECSINFLSVRGPELLNMYLGESERAVRECFDKARRAAPCVIFFDELDAICPVRGSGSHNPAANSIVGMMLTEIDGIKKQDQQIFVMGTTNRPHDIDSAMLRPGRLEKVIYVGAPDKVDRLDILQTITRNGTQPELADDVSLENLSNDERCKGFSGADLASLVNTASLAAFEEHIEAPEESKFEVKLKHFESAFEEVKPSISKRDLKCFEGFDSAAIINQCAKPFQAGTRTAFY